MGQGFGRLPCAACIHRVADSFSGIVPGGPSYTDNDMWVVFSTCQSVGVAKPGIAEIPLRGGFVKVPVNGSSVISYSGNKVCSFGWLKKIKGTVSFNSRAHHDPFSW